MGKYLDLLIGCQLRNLMDEPMARLLNCQESFYSALGFSAQYCIMTFAGLISKTWSVLSHLVVSSTVTPAIRYN